MCVGEMIFGQTFPPGANLPGAGVALEAQLRGLKVACVEQVGVLGWASCQLMGRVNIW